MRTVVRAVAGAAIIILLASTPYAAANDDAGSWFNDSHADKIDLGHYLGGDPVDDPGTTVGGIATTRYERKPAALCHDGQDGDIKGCAWLIQKVAAADCPKNAIPLDPLFSSTRTVTDGKPRPWSDWTYYAGTALCLTPASLKADVTNAFRSLTVKPSPIHTQPVGGKVLVNLPTITYTDAAPETFDIALGHGGQKIPVQIEAVPSSFTWSYGDGDSPLTTTDPGQAFPDQTVTHTYTHKGPTTLDLATSWTGRFRIQGLPADPADPATWTAIPGQAHTTSPTLALTVFERVPHLVDGQSDALTDQ